MKVNEKLSILLILEKSKESKDGKMPVTIRLTINSKRAELSLGLKIAPDIWNQESGTAKGSSLDARTINAAIDKAKTKLRRHYDLLDAQYEEVTSAMLKLAYLGKPQVQEVIIPDKTLLETTSFVLERLQKKFDKGKIAKGTLTKWKTTQKKLKAFYVFTAFRVTSH
jgi:hypothetical protein